MEMNRMPRVRRTAGAVATGIAALLVMTGCANPIEKAVEGLTQNTVEKLLEDATGVEVEGLAANAKVPDDFPSQVALPSGDPVHAMRLKNDDGISWTLSYQLGSEADFDALTEEMSARGMEEENALDLGEQMRSVQFRSDELFITATLLSDDDEYTVQMMVLQLQE